MATTPFPAPPASPESAAFYDAARQGRFLLPRCTSCGRTHWYPRGSCPFCFGSVEWVEGAGTGVIYSFSIMRRPEPARSIAYVTLTEGPTMLTSLVACDLEALRIGQAVRLCWQATAGDGPPVPCFTPSG